MLGVGRNGSSSLVLVVAVTLLVSVAANQAVYGQELMKATIGLSVDTLSFAPVFVADKLDLFRKHGVEAESIMFEGGGPLTVAVTTGAVDFGAHTSAGIVLPRARGIDVVAIANIVDRMTMEMVVRKDLVEKWGLSRNSPIEERLRALKGLTIGITSAGAATDVYTRYYLELVGLDPERDVQLLEIGGGGVLLAALQRGQIDAFQLSPPTPQIAEAQGYGTIFISAALGDVPGLDSFPYEIMITRRDVIESKPEVVRAVASAIAEANNIILDQPGLALMALQRHFDRLDPGTLLAGFAVIRETVPRNGLMTQDGWDRAVALMRRSGELPQDAEVDIEEGIAWTNEFLPQ